jgi:organic radical activating enzyme
MGQETPEVLADKIVDILRNDSNPDGLFRHPVSGQTQHLCFTGGEPLMLMTQDAIVGIMKSLQERDNAPSSITFETNGTQKLKETTKEFLADMEQEVFFSVSPKLWTVAGEKSAKAIKPETVAEYKDTRNLGQLKFVMGHKDREWEELDTVIKQFRDVGVDWPIWIMPVGAREEEQNVTAGEVARKAFQRGYNVAARVHVHLFGNLIGT